MLGALTDRDVAERLHRTLQGVRDRRKALGKPAFDHAPQPFRMEEEPKDRYARLFAEMPDRELSALLGWSYKRIRTRRQQLAGGKVRKKPPEWTLEEDRLLGTKPDHVLARKFGRPVAAVRHRREKKRIRMTKIWRPEDDAILGTRTDRQIGLLLGRSGGNVAWRRKQLGIPAKAKPRVWTEAEEELLGAKPDEELARLFGRTVVAVEDRRLELGRAKPDAVFPVFKVGASAGAAAPVVHAKPGAKFCTWTAEQDALLGQMSDAEVGRKLGFSPMRVRRRRRLLQLPNGNPKHRSWTQEEIALLGTRPDREVAPLVNRSVSNVRSKRLELGIPYCNADYEVWAPEELALLGHLPDEEIARRTGHAVARVRGARTKRHIRSVHRAAPRWRPEEDALLGTAPDAEIAARLHRTKGAVQFRRFKQGLKVS